MDERDAIIEEALGDAAESLGRRRDTAEGLDEGTRMWCIAAIEAERRRVTREIEAVPDGLRMGDVRRDLVLAAVLGRGVPERHDWMLGSGEAMARAEREGHLNEREGGDGD